MTLRRNDEIQAGIVAYLKSKIVITSLLYNDDPAEIKEDQWKGTTSNYPNIRVRMISNVPADAVCSSSRFSVGIQVFSELDSSREADEIAGIIMGVLHVKGFTSSGIAFTSTVTNVIPAISQDVRTWRSEVLVSGIAS
jgi:hypothetical protein